MKMLQKDLETLLADFGDFSRKASEELARRDEIGRTKWDPNESKAPAVYIGDLRFLDGGLVWYNGREGVNMTPIGQPQDYLKIRDNFRNVKTFLAELLDRGRLEYGDSKGPYGEINTADYAIWMYSNSQHQPFRRNTERAVAELLRNELEKNFKHLNRESAPRREDARKLVSQFNRLVGLLDVVSVVGKPDNGFVEAYGGLAHKAREGFMRDAHTLQYTYSQANIYNNILWALHGIQKNNELRDLWLQNIRDGQFGRVLASVHGIFGAYKTKEEKREQIPAVLAKLREKGWYLDPSRLDTYINIDGANLLNEVVGHLVSLTYWSGEVSPWDKQNRRFHHLDKLASSLDILSRKSAEDGKYHLSFTRYTPAGRKVLKTTYDLRTDKIQGDAQLENTVRAYFENGYEIGNKVKVTSLEGRQIRGNETRIVDIADGQNVDGLYEGVVGLNHTPILFLYDVKNGEVLLAEPSEQLNMLSSGGGWVGRRVGLENVTTKVPYGTLQSVSQFAQRVNEPFPERNKVGYLGPLSHHLRGKLSDKVASPLSLVISSRFKAGDGLVQ